MFKLKKGMYVRHTYDISKYKDDSNAQKPQQNMCNVKKKKKKKKKKKHTQQTE